MWTCSSWKCVSVSESVLCTTQVTRTAHGRAAWPTSAERCSSKPSITCWSAASWIDPSFVSASGLSSPMKRMRSQSTKGTLYNLNTFSSKIWLDSLWSTYIWDCTFCIKGMVHRKIKRFGLFVLALILFLYGLLASAGMFWWLCIHVVWLQTFNSSFVV